MAVFVKARIVRVGNSRGIRIPKVVLDQLNMGTEIEMAVQSHRLVIRSARHPREGWDKQFAAMAAEHDDQLLAETSSKWDEQEWEW